MFDNITTIIFDAEGVVVDGESLWDKEAKLFLEKRGLVYDRGKHKPLMAGRSIREAALVLQKIYGFPGTPEELGKERLESMEKLFSELVFIDDFVEFYDAVKGSFKTCIATSMDRRLFAIADNRLNLSRIFNHNIFSISDIGNIAKPNPDIFLYAAKKMGSKPENCMAIEDSPLGILAAKRAGMMCIGLATTFDKSKLGDADIIAGSFKEISMQINNPIVDILH